MEHKPDGPYDMTEDQLMESFTFGVAARLLGVEISSGDDEDLMTNVVFNKYRARKGSMAPPTATSPSPETKKTSWWQRLFGKNSTKG